MRAAVNRKRAVVQMAWGVALVLAGLGVFYRIPQVMPKIRQIEYLAAIIGFVYFCLYLMGVILLAGGARKIYLNYRKLKQHEK